MSIKYPQVKVALQGEEGNAFAILGRVRKAMKEAGVSNDEIESYLKEAMSGNFDNLLQVTMKWVDTDPES
jgi:hypothetical protein